MGPFGRVQSFAIAAVVLVVGSSLLLYYRSIAAPGFEKELTELAAEIDSMIARAGPAFERELEVPENTLVSFSGMRISVSSGWRSYSVPDHDFALPLEGPSLGPGKYTLKIELVGGVIRVSQS